MKAYICEEGHIVYTPDYMPFNSFARCPYTTCVKPIICVVDASELEMILMEPLKRIVKENKNER